MSLRRWQINPTQPHSLILAADARLSATDYLDDQVWLAAPGELESPALTLQTRYGGRVGLASLVPMWMLDGRMIYQAQTYTHPPLVTAFAPGYIQAKAQLTPDLVLQADFWAIDSHAVGARFTVANTGAAAQTLRLDVFAHIGAEGKELPMQILALNGTPVLHLGQIVDIHPVVLVENGQSIEDAISPRLGIILTIQPGSKAAARFVHVALPDVTASIRRAADCLKQNWDTAFKKIRQAATAIPDIRTGDSDMDAAIAFSYQQLVNAFLRPTASLPHASFVATRQPDRGWSRSGDGTDHIRSWNGQPMPLAYLVALAAASIDSQLAQGIVRNYIAVQQRDGAIDWKPGLSGQRAGMLGLPLLARLAWSIFQYTEDGAFLREVYPALNRAFLRWFEPDADRDGDGLPEWQSETQTGYVSTPTFSSGLPWGQHLDISTVEAPDLMAYLLSEAISLHAIAYYLRDDAGAQALTSRIDRLKTALDALYHDGRYTYRDRDTHAVAKSVVVLPDGAGDEPHLPALALTPPQRLIVQIIGGTGKAPRMTLHLSGLGVDGQPVEETANSELFIWSHGRGVYTSQQVFSRIDRIQCDGLIRVYRIRAITPDLTRLDISALLPLWSAGLAPERAAEIISLLIDPAHFWRANGVTMCSAQDPEFDPANAKGSGGVWAYWTTLLGEGLIEANRLDLAADLLKRLLRAQTAVLRAQKSFSEFYHGDEAAGLGESGHLMGIVPLHLLLRVLGVRIISPHKVWVGGAFHWGSPVSITQHGVAVERSASGTKIRFPSGAVFQLAPASTWQEVIDNPLSG